MEQPQANNNSSSYIDVRNIVKSGYLKKLKTMRKKFFVIWGATETSSAVLEYYDNEKKFRLSLGAKRAIHLSTCFNINAKSDTKNKYVISLYTRDEMFAVVMEDEEQQNEWMKVLLEQQRASGDGRPIPLIEHIWQATVKSKGLGSSQNLSGNYRLCLMAGNVNLVKMNAENGDLKFPLSVVRRCGHTDCFFFMEVGRQAVTGSGEMWMQVEDSVIAHNIHEATLNAMRSSGESEDARPRSHSGSTSSIASADAKSCNAGTIPRRSSTTSWRQRCDSLPVPNRAAARSLRNRGSSEGEDGLKEEDGTTPLTGLIKSNSSKLRPRTSSEGESHFHGNPDGRESPNKNRGRHSMPAMRSASVSSGYRPMSVHRIVSQPISNSPPIPNSPLSESPRNLPDDRFVHGSGVGHSPTDGYSKDDHFFGSDYNNGHMNSLKRSKGRAADTQLSIREESIESTETDEYMHMAGSSKTGDEMDSYMDMSSSASHTPRSSFSGSIGGSGSPPKSPVTRSGSKVPHDLVTPSSSTPFKEGYMMMAPSSAKQRTSSQSEPLISPSDNTPYMYMSPPVPTSKAHKKALPPNPPALVLTPTAGHLDTSSASSPTLVENSALDSVAAAEEGGPYQEPSGERLYDSYANVEFSPVLAHKALFPDQRSKGVDPSREVDVKFDYMNMAYNQPKKAAGGREINPSGMSNGVKEPHKGKLSQNEGEASVNPVNDEDYAKMDFGSREVPVGKKASASLKDMQGSRMEGGKPAVEVKSSPPPPPAEERMFEGDFMNVDLTMGSTRLSFPNSPVTRSGGGGSKVNSGTTVNSRSLRNSLEELRLRDGGCTSKNRLSRPSSLGGGTVHPKGSLTPNLNLHHSPVNSAAPPAKKHELNYIDVEADPPRRADSSSPLNPSSPYRGPTGEDKGSEPVTYATIDFTKSQGLKNISAMRESRF